MRGLDRLSPMKGTVHGRTRQGVHDDEVPIVSERVRVSGANGVPENLMYVGDGLMRARVNENVRVNRGELTVHAEVHGVFPSVGGLTFSRGISPLMDRSRSRPYNMLLTCRQQLRAP